MTNTTELPPIAQDAIEALGEDVFAANLYAHLATLPGFVRDEEGLWFASQNSGLLGLGELSVPELFKLVVISNALYTAGQRKTVQALQGLLDRINADIDR